MDILSELVKFLQEVSPLVWQSLIKQVYAEAVGYLIWGIGLAGASVMFVRFAKARLEDDDSDILGVFAYIAVVIASCVEYMANSSKIDEILK